MPPRPVHGSPEDWLRRAQASLAMGLEGIGIEIPESIDQATVLTRYAMDTRYPGGFEPVGAAEHQEAVRLAETVVAWAWTQIAPPGG